MGPLERIFAAEQHGQLCDDLDRLIERITAETAQIDSEELAA